MTPGARPEPASGFLRIRGPSSPKAVAELLLLVVTAVWGSTFIFMKNALAYTSPTGFIFLRFLLATALALAFFGRSLAGLRARTVWKGTVIGILLYLGLFLQVKGLETTLASNSAFITAFYILFVPLIQGITLRRFPKRGILVGAVLALAGLFLLSGGATGELDLAARPGDFLTFLGSIAWTAEILAIDRLAPGEEGRALVCVEFLVVLLLSGVSWVLSGPVSVSLAPGLLVSLAVTGIGGTFLAFSVQTIFQSRTDPSRTALIFSFEPVWALGFALLIPGTDGTTESLTWIRGLGCLLVLLGVLSAEFIPLNRLRPAMKDGIPAEGD